MIYRLSIFQSFGNGKLFQISRFRKVFRSGMYFIFSRCPRFMLNAVETQNGQSTVGGQWRRTFWSKAFNGGRVRGLTATVSENNHRGQPERRSTGVTYGIQVHF